MVGLSRMSRGTPTSEAKEKYRECTLVHTGTSLLRGHPALERITASRTRDKIDATMSSACVFSTTATTDSP